jgi:uncharacterized membrane protein
MKALLVITVALVLAFGGYFTYYRCATAPTQAMLSGPDGEMEWLRNEYHLSDAQFWRIREMHREYAPKCDLMCQKIAKANERLEQLIKANKTFTPEVDAAMNDCVTVQAECRRALLAHVYAVSAEMSPEDGARYLQMMTARLVEPGLSHESVISQSAK